MRGQSSGMCITTGLCCALTASAWAGPDWVEPGDSDAGSSPDSAQPTTGKSPLERIHGRLGSVTPTGGPTALGVPQSDFEDMFVIFIDDPSNFRATTIACTFDCNPDCGGCAEFDTQLWLFDVSGLGLLGNQFHFEIAVDGPRLGEGPQGDSELVAIPCDGSGPGVTQPGLYLIAITQFNMPSSPGGPIFDFNATTGQCPSGEVSGPDGAGGGQPITGWFNNQDQGPVGTGAAYVIFLEGVQPAFPEVQLGMDIKPGGCPNPFNRNSNGVLPVSLCGSSAIDIHDVVLSSVRMSRPDGAGGYIGSLPPHEGPPGPHSTYGDEATPYTGAPGGCHELEGDGITDLNMKFKSQQIVDDLQLNDLLPGALVEIVLRGELTSGEEFTANDWVRLVPPNSAPGLLTVQSNVRRSWINASPPDLNLDGGGFGTVFQRTYPQGTVVQLSAQAVPGMVFRGWRMNNQTRLTNSTNLNVAIQSADPTVYAVFEPGSSPDSISAP
jgi:hypothetical protein